MGLLKKFSLIALACLLTSCGTVSDLMDFSDKEAAPLEGERISVLELAQSLEPEDPVLEAQGLLAPSAWRNEFWPQVGGYPNHSMQHLELAPGPLGEVWSVDIGDGSSDKLPLTAQPIVVDGLVFTMDTDSRLSAFDVVSGKLLWDTDVADPDEDDTVISGGIGYANGVLFVTNGFNELLSVNPKSGDMNWRKKLPAPARAAPTIMDGRVFVTTLDNRLIALSATDGAMLWEHRGLNETAGLLGAASPAASRDIVIPVFSSGEVTALRVENGSVAWSDNLSNLRRFGGLSGLADIKGLPVIDKGLVVAISYSGRLVAIDERSGTRVWQREIGGSQTPWLAGNHVFVLSSDNELIAMGRDNGVIRWVTDLPRFEDADDKEGPIVWTGPILAGGRLILAGSRGRILEIIPETGKPLGQWSVGETVSIPPVIAGGTLFILTEDGMLSAFR